MPTEAQDPFLLLYLCRIHPWHNDVSGDTSGAALTCCSVTLSSKAVHCQASIYDMLL